MGLSKSTYGVRSFYVNPKYIVSLTNNDKFDAIHQSRPIIENLMPEARFSKIIVATGMHGNTHYELLGSPEQILRTLKE